MREGEEGEQKEELELEWTKGKKQMMTKEEEGSHDCDG